MKSHPKRRRKLSIVRTDTSCARETLASDVFVVLRLHRIVELALILDKFGAHSLQTLYGPAQKIFQLASEICHFIKKKEDFLVTEL